MIILKITHALDWGFAGANQPLEQELVIAQSTPFGRPLFIDADAHSACSWCILMDKMALTYLGTGQLWGVFLIRMNGFHIVRRLGFPV